MTRLDQDSNLDNRQKHFPLIMVESTLETNKIKKVSFGEILVFLN